MKTAVLLIMFNRLSYTKQVLAEIAKAKPERFYIACDGPRSHEEGLEKYRENKQVWEIDGWNRLGNYPSADGVLFSKIPNTWGWATWADRWEHFPLDYEQMNVSDDFLSFSKSLKVRLLLLDIFFKMKVNDIDAWDYEWLFLIHQRQGYCVHPSSNLITNIGEHGVHFTSDEPNKFMNTPRYELKKLAFQMNANSQMNILILTWKNAGVARRK